MGELQATIQIKDEFLELAHPCEITILCPNHVTWSMRGMMTLHHPHPPSTYNQ